MARVMNAVISTPPKQPLQLPEIRAAIHSLHKNPTQIEEEKSPIEPSRGITSTKLLAIFFYLHLLLVTTLAVILTVRGFFTHHTHLKFEPSKWYPPMLASVALGGTIGLTWQMLTRYHPSKALKLAFYFSPLLTCAMGVLLISTDSGPGLAFGILSLLAGFVGFIYACHASPRFDHGVEVLAVSTAFPPPKTAMVTVMAVGVAVVYGGVMMGGVGGAVAAGTRIDKLMIGVIVFSMAWTMQVIKNAVQVAVSHVKYHHFAGGDETLSVCSALRSAVAVNHSMGAVCMGSILVPCVSLVRGSARVVTLIGGDSDEFLFSCADCYSSIASSLAPCANRWGLVHVGVYSKGIVRASTDTWEMFRRAGMERLIDLDLTSSFCFLCGVAGGAASSLLGGSWSLVVHKEYATEILAYGFLVGYFLTRIAMAWPQACVSAYHVAYAENPQSARFDATIPVRLQELERHQV